MPFSVEHNSSGKLRKVIMPRPSDFHAHLRLDEMMRAVAYFTMVWVKYLLIMPNTGPIDTIEKVIDYYKKLMALAEELGLKPVFIMTIYFSHLLTWQEVERLAKLPFTVAVKYYPPHKGATTGSGLGMTIAEGVNTLRAMARNNIRLLGHFESVYDKDGNMLPMALREGYFMEHEYPRLREAHPELKISAEHVSTALGVDRIKDDDSGNTVGTFTQHHISPDLTIDEIMKKSWRNFGRCMPIPKSIDDVEACLEFVLSGDTRAIMGTDTAPHLSQTKQGPFDEASCGQWWPHALAKYVQVFENAGKLDNKHFVPFACYNGPDWWGLDRPSDDDLVYLVDEPLHDIPDPVNVDGTNDVVISLGYTGMAEDDPANDRLRIGLALAK